MSDDIYEFYNKYKGKQVKLIKLDSSRYNQIGILGGIADSNTHCAVLFDGCIWRSYNFNYLVPIENYNEPPLPLPG